MNDRRTVRLVISILGLLAVVLSLGEILLVHQIIEQAQGAGSIDPAAAASAGSVGTLAATVIGALGATLVSTGSVDVQGLQALADAQADPEPPPAPEPPPEA